MQMAKTILKLILQAQNLAVSIAVISDKIHWRTCVDVEKKKPIIWQAEWLAASDEPHHTTAFATGFDSAVRMKLLCLQISGTSLIDRNGPQQLMCTWRKTHIASARMLLTHDSDSNDETCCVV